MHRVLVAAAVSWIAVAAAPAGAAEPLTRAQWREDLAALTAHLLERHREPFHTLTREAFDAEVAGIEGAVEVGDDVAVVLGMARLLAAVGDGHTRLTLPVDPEHLGFRLGHTPDPEPAAGVPRLGVLPVRLRLLGERLYVVETTPEWTRLLGAEVVRVGPASVGEAVAAVAPWCPHDTPSGLRRMASTRLAVPAVLAAAGLGDSRAAATLAVRPTEDGEEEVLRLPALAHGQPVEWKPLAPPAAVPPGWFRLETLPGENALYLRVDRIGDEPGGETLGELGVRLAAALVAQKPRKVVLDLRWNHGGDGSLARAVVLPLVRWEGSSEPGRLYTLVGPETFSAAVLLLDRLEQWTQNLLVGEEPGSGPASYGDAERAVLPHSGLTARVSTRIHVGWTGGETRRRYAVDLPVAPTVEDLRAGRDPVLAAALAHEPGASPGERLVRAFEAGGVDSALMLWFRARTDPATALRVTDESMNHLARHLLDTGEPALAAALFALNRESHPDSLAACRGEAEAHLAAGDPAAARAALDRALALAPDDPELRALAERVAAAGG